MGDYARIISQLETGTAHASLAIDICVALNLAPKEYFGSKVESYSWASGVINTTDGIRHLDALRLPEFLNSLDAAIALVERTMPGCFYLVGKGVIKKQEPPFGAQLLFGSDEVLGDGESNHSLQHALLIALLRSLEQQQRERALKIGRAM